MLQRVSTSQKSQLGIDSNALLFMIVYVPASAIEDLNVLNRQSYTPVTLGFLISLDSNEVCCNECHSIDGGAMHEHVMTFVHNISDSSDERNAQKSCQI